MYILTYACIHTYACMYVDNKIIQLQFHICMCRENINNFYQPNSIAILSRFYCKLYVCICMYITVFVCH